MMSRVAGGICEVKQNEEGGGGGGERLRGKMLARV